MSDLWGGLVAAFWLVVTADAQLMEIALRSLQVSVTAVVIASLIGMPLGAWLAVRRFRMRRFVIAFLNALMGLPPVV
ncbi:MAG: ABC transporter permease, partial [Pseudomonadota bacterium]